MASIQQVIEVPINTAKPTFVHNEHAAPMPPQTAPAAQKQNIPETDVLLVGAGFGSYTMLNRLRKLGLSCKVYEKGSKSGGIWYWNCYVSRIASLQNSDRMD